MSSPIATADITERRRNYVVGLWLRIVASGAFLLLLSPLTFSGLDFPFTKCSAAYYGLIALVSANAVYWFVGQARGFPVRDFVIHWCLDLALISTVIYGLGGARIPSAITPYILIVITSAVFMSKKTSFIVAGGSAAAYSGLMLTERLGLIDPSYDIPIPPFSVGLNIFAVGTPLVMVFLVAFVAGTLGDQLNSANQLLALRNQTLGERNAQLEGMQKEIDFQSKILTHDIRSPVAAAFGALAELRRALVAAALDRDEIALLEIAAGNLARVEEMIDALEQAQEGQGASGVWEPVNLGEVIGELRIEFQRDAKRKGTEIVISEALPSVVGSRARLVVMFRNLLMNALRYTSEEGGGLIKIGAEDNGSEWRVFVVDNGPGIQEEFQEAIFEMFRKAPQKKKSPGMGLGLALVRKVAEQHGGSVWVQSDGRSGSTFWVALPKKNASPKSEVGEKSGVERV